MKIEFYAHFFFILKIWIYIPSPPGEEEREEEREETRSRIIVERDVFYPFISIHVSKFRRK